MGTIVRLLLRTQVTRPRLAFLVVLAGLGVLLGIAVGASDPGTRADDAYRLVGSYGLGLLVPVVALVFASATLGDPVEDKTFVYVWLRPVPALRIALGGVVAALTVVVPAALAASVALAAATRSGMALVAGTAAASALAVAGYVPLFVGLGLVVRRALLWGLAYLLIWEGFVARSGTSAARLSVLVYARSLLARVAGFPAPKQGSAPATAVIVPLVLAAVATAITTWLVRRADVA